jgi:hypothetical protein
VRDPFTMNYFDNEFLNKYKINLKNEKYYRYVLLQGCQNNPLSRDSLKK